MLLCMGKLSPIYGAESTNQRDTDTPSHVYDSTMDPVHIPVPNSCNCDVVPNERANTASTLIASRYPIIINDIGLFERIFFYSYSLGAYIKPYAPPNMHMRPLYPHQQPNVHLGDRNQTLSNTWFSAPA